MFNPLNIALGTTNAIKIQALEEVIKDYPLFSHAKIYPFSVSSEISEQPLTLEEIIDGAKNRAKNAYSSAPSCAYSFGIESGLFKAEGSQTGFLEACICCIYDGIRYPIGMSCGFEVPTQILNFILNDQMDLSQACYHSGITSNKKLGAAEGLIGMLTKGRIDRKEYTKQAIRTALVQLENETMYNNILERIESHRN